MYRHPDLYKREGAPLPKYAKFKQKSVKRVVLRRLIQLISVECATVFFYSSHMDN